MVSMGPYSMPYNFTYQWDQPCRKDQLMYRKNSLLYHLINDPRLQSYEKLVRKAQLDTLFNDEQTSITLFAPVNIDPKLTNLDILDARTVVNSYTIPALAETCVLKNNGATFYNSKNNANPILITLNFQGDLIVNEYCKVIGMIRADNGIIYLIDTFAPPYNVL